MIDIKLNLVVVVPGATMMSEQECSKLLKEPVINKKGKYAGKQAKDKKGNLLYYNEIVPDMSKFDKHVFKIFNKEENKPETYVYFTRKNRPAKQTINISEEAYNYFISVEVPSGFRVPLELRASLKRSHESFETQAWKKIGEQGRLEWHLKSICDSMGGTMESYTVFDN